MLQEVKLTAHNSSFTPLLCCVTQSCGRYILPDARATGRSPLRESLLQTIEKIYKELSAPDHPVSIAMEKQKTVPEVRIVEGLDK